MGLEENEIRKISQASYSQLEEPYMLANIAYQKNLNKASLSHQHYSKSHLW